MVGVKERTPGDSDNVPLKLPRKTAQKAKKPTSLSKAKDGTAPSTKVRSIAITSDAWCTLICVFTDHVHADTLDSPVNFLRLRADSRSLHADAPSLRGPR